MADTPRSPNLPTRHWYIDEIIVAAFAFFGVGGAVFLPLRFGFTSVPPIVVSFLLATGLAALTYKYLGGIQTASLKIGTLKLGGALAALDRYTAPNENFVPVAAHRWGAV